MVKLDGDETDEEEFTPAEIEDMDETIKRYGISRVLKKIRRD